MIDDYGMINGFNEWLQYRFIVGVFLEYDLWVMICIGIRIWNMLYLN